MWTYILSRWAKRPQTFINEQRRYTHSILISTIAIDKLSTVNLEKFSSSRPGLSVSLEATGSLPCAALRGHAPAPIGGLVLLPGCYDIQSGLVMDDEIIDSLLRVLEAEAEAEAELVRQHTRQSEMFPCQNRLAHVAVPQEALQCKSTCSI